MKKLLAYAAMAPLLFLLGYVGVEYLYSEAALIGLGSLVSAGLFVWGVGQLVD